MINSSFKKNILVIGTSFIFAFLLLPNQISVENFQEHISGIAFGFGFAWLMIMLSENKDDEKTQKRKQNEEGI